ncbi:MAG: hypothetical protein KAQ78_07185, partial [Candidatus Latescibacteria bacterium]|nr:hypothetical protein [Candidatus Latescibacterota bacterium]
MDKNNFPFHRKDAKDAKPLPSQGVAVRWSFSCISCISWWEYENDFVWELRTLLWHLRCEMAKQSHLWTASQVALLVIVLFCFAGGSGDWLPAPRT